MANKQYSIKSLVSEQNNRNQAQFEDSPNYIASGAAGAGGLAGAGALANTYRRKRKNKRGFVDQLKQDVRGTGSGINQSARSAASGVKQGLKNTAAIAKNPVDTTKTAARGVRDDFAGARRDYSIGRKYNFGRGMSGAAAAKRFAGSNTGKVGLGATLLGLSAAGAGALAGNENEE